MSDRFRNPSLGAAAGWLAVLVLGLAGAGSAQQDAAPEGALSTASYGLFTLDGDGDRGQLQVIERAEGGTRIVVSIPHEDDASYRAAVYEGDCGPDRPVVLELAPFGIGGDPFVSETISELSFAQLTEGDHFAYLFRGDGIDTPEEEGLNADAVACGEVGADANLGQDGVAQDGAGED